jgi:hypothetical protein
MNLFRKQTHVKPLASGLFSEQWLIVYQTPLQAFRDDRRRYGWRVAWYNLRRTLAR